LGLRVGKRNLVKDNEKFGGREGDRKEDAEGSFRN